jgi:hypothetical protein
MENKETKIIGYKGFDKDLKCRDYQYEVGKTFEYEGDVSCCDRGFHFCENPFDVFEYYPPSDSRYCSVEGSGKSDKDNKGSKVSVSKLHISAEIGLKGIIDAGVKFILDKVNWQGNKIPSTEKRSAATNTGDCSAASVEGKDSIAIVTGKESKAKGAIGCWIVLTERGEWDGETYPIIEVKAFKVDGVSIKENTYYSLVNGKPVECE